MTDFTYLQLDGILRGLGFTVRKYESHTNVYKHAASGAVLLLPSLSNERVIPHHLIATRATLDGFGIPEPPEFTAQLQAS